MPLISIPEITVYRPLPVKVVPRPEVEGAKPWMTNGELQLLKAGHDRRRMRRRAVLVLGLGAVALLGLLVGAQVVFFAKPTEAALSGQMVQVAQQALDTYSTPSVPLALSSTSVVLEQKLDRSRQRYQFTVSLRLLQPLYVPAHSNGTLEYDQLRIALKNARARPRDENPQDMGGFPADLPQLVQRSHFAGEKTRITTTLEARRSGWSWKFSPLSRSPFVCRRPLQGSILHSFGQVAIYDELRPDPALGARLDEIRSFLRRRAGVADNAAPARREPR
jgi:hypothetical protein